MPQRLTFYLLLETSRHFTRELFRGVITWSKLYGPANLVVSAGHTAQELPQLAKSDNVGIIARLTTPGVIEAVKRLNIPLVTIEPSLEEFVQIKEQYQISEIKSNASAVADMALNHFTDRGFRHFAFCGLPHRIWSESRQHEFETKVTARGFHCDVYPCEDEVNLDRDAQRTKLAQWLATLPKPVAVLACNDDRGALVIEACHQKDFSVPEQIAVLGVDNDDLVCELSSPAMSSIAFDLKKAGFETANLLWQLVSKSVAGYHHIPVEPTHVVTRISTDVMAQDDELVARAVRFIRGMSQRPIGVADVARELEVSRRTLERRFGLALGRSVRRQIELFRFEQARQLLLQTNDTVEQIAILSGFQNLKPMLRVFLRETGVSPTLFRKKYS